MSDTQVLHDPQQQGQGQRGRALIETLREVFPFSLCTLSAGSPDQRCCSRQSKSRSSSRVQTPKEPLISRRQPQGGSYYLYDKASKTRARHNTYNIYNWEKYNSPTEELRVGVDAIIEPALRGRPVTAGGRSPHHGNSYKQYTWDMYANPTTKLRGRTDKEKEKRRKEVAANKRAKSAMRKTVPPQMGAPSGAKEAQKRSMQQDFESSLDLMVVPVPARSTDRYNSLYATYKPTRQLGRLMERECAKTKVIPHLAC